MSGARTRGRLIMPIAREYAPELVIISAGFDAAEGDPLGGMRLSPAGYAQMTAQLQTLAKPEEQHKEHVFTLDITGSCTQLHAGENRTQNA